MARQTQDQVLLRPHPLQMLQLLLLGTLIKLQRDLQARILGFEVGERHRRGAVEGGFKHEQVTAQQMPIVLFVRFAQLHQAQGAPRGMQRVMHHVMRAGPKLGLYRIVQAIARFRLHQAGKG